MKTEIIIFKSVTDSNVKWIKYLGKRLDLGSTYLKISILFYVTDLKAVRSF